MSTLKTFYDQLPDPTKDLFLQLTNDLRTGATPGKIQKLKMFMQELRLEIEEINRRRKGLGNQLDNVTRVMEVVDGWLRQNPNTDLEVKLFKEFLGDYASQLKVEIEGLRPANKLEKKFSVSQRIRELDARLTMADSLASEVVRRTPVRLPDAMKEKLDRAAEQPLPKVAVPDHTEELVDEE